MPLYDVECQACKAVYEVMMSYKVANDPKGSWVVQCSHCCDYTEHKKLISAHKNYIVTESAYRPGERPGDKRTRK